MSLPTLRVVQGAARANGLSWSATGHASDWEVALALEATPVESASATLRERIRVLEGRVREAEDTLDAIRRGDLDAVMVARSAEDYRLFTLQSSDHPYRVLIEQIQEGAVTLAEDGTMLYANQRLATMLGLSPEQVIGRKLQTFLLPEDASTLVSMLLEAKLSGTRKELTLCAAAGRRMTIHLSLSFLRHEDDQTLLCGMLTDLTEHERHVRVMAEANARILTETAARERSEDALRQAYKMEAVGQLTGGLAHDFNNLLTVIVGNLELLEMQVALDELYHLEEFITAAQDATSRAAALTHRLLTFSRQQTLAPKSVDPGKLVAGMITLVQRTVGPEIKVEVVAADGLWPTLVDSNQLENALLNLCINARDAMPHGGTLTIATANTTLDDPQGLERDMAPGEYVTLCVRDTGTGMSADVVAHAFEPFFTTKSMGAGTGLGLSMVYGFAKQAGGQVRIRSQEGVGTSVAIHLPRNLMAMEAEQAQPAPANAARAKCGETVLTVDDDPTVRSLVSKVLQRLGYAVLEASDGASGARILQSDVRIDLLITDVGMPGGMNGRQLAHAGRQARPGLKVLFITGYAENAAIGDGEVEPGTDVLTKPFSLKMLATKIKASIASK